MDCPTLYFIDMSTATIFMENIVGVTVKQRLSENQETEYKDVDTGMYSRSG